MKKTICLLMILALLLSLATMLTGCGSDDKKILGTWTADIDYTEYFNDTLQYMSQSNKLMEHFEAEEFIVTTTLVFRDDGSYSMYIDEASAEKALLDIEYILYEGFRGIMEERYLQLGLPISLEEWLKNQTHAIWDMVDEAMTEDVKDLLLNNLIDTSTGNYRIEDGKIYMTRELTESLTEDNYDTYTLEGDVLTLMECHCKTDEALGELGEAAKTIYPITFHRTAEE